MARSIAGNREVLVQTGAFLTSAAEVGAWSSGVFDGARSTCATSPPSSMAPKNPPVRLLRSRRGDQPDAQNEQPAVTLSIAKRPGANAIAVAHDVLRKVETLRGREIPANVSSPSPATTARRRRKSPTNCCFHMGIAIIGVSLLILLTLGWRESIIVGIAIPCTLALTLLVFYLYGYTLNRITLFA
jgi:hypothetical protein